MKKVIVEMKVSPGFTMEVAKSSEVAAISGFLMDHSYAPVPVSPDPVHSLDFVTAGQEAVLIRGEVDEDGENELRKSADVVGVWTDARIEHFEEDCSGKGALGFVEVPDFTGGTAEEDLDELSAFDLELSSPCSPTDCQSSVPKGTISDVVAYLRCDRLWAKGFKGDGIVIGICDNGVNKEKVPAVIGGWSPTPTYKPGTASPSSHGTMCAFDAVGMAPEAKIYDIAILKSAGGGMSGLLSDAISAYHWALSRYKEDRTPQILSNSWGMYQKSWAPDYATDPKHPFTRKVIDIIDAGITVTFAAGNCGSQCPSGRCGSDTGPGRSIWGANGHPRVITVGGANIFEEWIGYSSQGPAALEPDKPDFCAPSHFKGATSCDNGTSTSNPVCAGVIALLKSCDNALTQEKIKEALQRTALNLCAPGWDPNAGHGMIQAEAAFNYIFKEILVTPPASTMWVHGHSVNVEIPDDLISFRRSGPRASFLGKPGTTNWFHFAIPTPVIDQGKPAKIDAVVLQFLAKPDVWVTNVHIYEGCYKIASFDRLNLTGNHWLKRFDIKDRRIRYGLGVSVGVYFGENELERHFISFYSAGAFFLRQVG